jgi:hypothetical protein
MVKIVAALSRVLFGAYWYYLRRMRYRQYHASLVTGRLEQNLEQNADNVDEERRSRVTPAVAVSDRAR